MPPFFFNHSATTGLYTLSLHDALPICPAAGVRSRADDQRPGRQKALQAPRQIGRHTSELQSQFHLVCRLLLEKKKQDKNTNPTSADFTARCTRKGDGTTIT